MKAKLTITLEEELIPEAKEYARTHGLSLSQLIENSVRGLTRPVEKNRRELPILEKLRRFPRSEEEDRILGELEAFREAYPLRLAGFDPE